MFNPKNPCQNSQVYLHSVENKNNLKLDQQLCVLTAYALLQNNSTRHLENHIFDMRSRSR